ncbi:MAG: DUF4157 domain-containing protein [Cyanobacteria bacterium P01_F01_bin.3]
MICRATIQARPAKYPIVQNKRLQRKHTAIGQHMLGSQSAIPFIQPKLTVGQPNDKYEQEADRVAEQVMRMPSPEGVDPQVQHAPLPKVQRACSTCEEKKKLQAKEIPGSTPEVTPAVASRIQSLQGGGQPLPTSTRNFFEPRFGQDFSQVRVHVDAQSTQALNAKAYTIGKDIVFDTKQYAPDTTSGRYLLAHELTHIIQQSANQNVGRQTAIQRQPGKSQHSLMNPRFAGNRQLEATLNNKLVITVGFCGDAVRLIQEALLDLGFELPEFGADCEFGSETQNAVAKFQAMHSESHGTLVDGQVGFQTMELLDQEAPVGLPPTSKCPPCQPTPKEEELECEEDQDCIDRGDHTNHCTVNNICIEIDERIRPLPCECDPRIDFNNYYPYKCIPTELPSCGIWKKIVSGSCLDEALEEYKSKVKACKEEYNKDVTSCAMAMSKCTYETLSDKLPINCLEAAYCPGASFNKKEECLRKAFRAREEDIRNCSI